MRFAITAVDRYLGVFEAFVRAGWEPVKLFTVPVNGGIDRNDAVINYAKKTGAAVQATRFAESDLRDLKEQGCEALIVASYSWKIPDWRPWLKYAVNFHSSPLPLGRGPYPQIKAILEGRDSWAVTCHQVTPEFDSGDILAAEPVALAPDECHERLDLKIQLAAKKLAATVAADFPALWAAAKPQGEGSYWLLYTLQDRIVDFRQPVDKVLRHIRAFGATESFAQVNDGWLVIRRAVGWQEAHSHPPGMAIHVFNQSVVVAAADGYIGLLDIGLARPEVAAELVAGRKI